MIHGTKIGQPYRRDEGALHGSVTRPANRTSKQNSFNTGTKPHHTSRSLMKAACSLVTSSFAATKATKETPPTPHTACFHLRHSITHKTLLATALPHRVRLNIRRADRCATHDDSSCFTNGSAGLFKAVLGVLNSYHLAIVRISKFFAVHSFQFPHTVSTVEGAVQSDILRRELPYSIHTAALPIPFTDAVTHLHPSSDVRSAIP